MMLRLPISRMGYASRHIIRTNPNSTVNLISRHFHVTLTSRFPIHFYSSLHPHSHIHRFAIPNVWATPSPATSMYRHTRAFSTTPPESEFSTSSSSSSSTSSSSSSTSSSSSSSTSSSSSSTSTSSTSTPKRRIKKKILRWSYVKNLKLDWNFNSEKYKSIPIEYPDPNRPITPGYTIETDPNRSGMSSKYHEKQKQPGFVRDPNAKMSYENPYPWGRDIMGGPIGPTGESMKYHNPNWKTWFPFRYIFYYYPLYIKFTAVALIIYGIISFFFDEEVAGDTRHIIYKIRNEVVRVLHSIVAVPWRLATRLWPYDDSLLLPDETPDPYGRRTRTLVLEWDKVLVSNGWSRAEGGFVRKRPEFEEFLKRVFKAGWEIVIFTKAPQEPTERNILAADPSGGQFLSKRIFIDGINTYDGGLVKDLSRLGRDLSRTIVVDINNELYHNHEDQVMMIKPFHQDHMDKELLKIVTFLENISRYNVHDVRPYIKKWNASPADPTIFAEEEEARIEAAARLREAKRSLSYGRTRKIMKPRDEEEEEEVAQSSSQQQQGGWLSWLGFSR